MTPQEREKALTEMQSASDHFYREAIRIGNHPFIEFTGLINEYIKAARHAHEADIDFSQCNTHSGRHLPLEEFQVAYINEKLECIFTGRSFTDQSLVGDHADTNPEPTPWSLLEEVLKNPLPTQDGETVCCTLEDFMLMQRDSDGCFHFKNEITKNYLIVRPDGSYFIPVTKGPFNLGFFATHGEL